MKSPPCYTVLLLVYHNLTLNVVSEVSEMVLLVDDVAQRAMKTTVKDCCR